MAPFVIPPITYPLRLDTVGMLLATGAEITVHCCNQDCRQEARINLVRIARRHGMGAGILRPDLLRLCYCASCRAAGRPDRNISFIHHALTVPFSDLTRRAGAWCGPVA
jgi:hypothetical protein